MRPAAFCSGERAHNDRLRAVQHKPQFQRCDQSGIKHLAFILDGDARPTGLEIVDPAGSLFHALLLTKYRHIAVHGGAHFQSKGRGPISLTLSGENGLDELAIRFDGRIRNGQRGNRLGIFGGTHSRPTAEDHRLQKRICAKPVASMQTDAGRFSRCKKPRQAFPLSLNIPTTALSVGFNASHLVMHSRPDGQRLFG